MNLDMNIILGIIGIVNGAQFLFTHTINRKIDKLSNGCFERHGKIQRELGQNEIILDALHRRLDDSHREV